MSGDGDGVLSRSSASASGPDDVGVRDAPGASSGEQRDPRTRWEVRGELGWGGMGRVLLAWDRWLAREVAIKEPTSHADLQRFQREALITARMEHPAIVPIFDVGATPDGRPWFAMRVVRGRSLAALLEHATQTERDRLLRFVMNACEAVAYAHDRGIVHRDLKPANIMIGAFGETQVIDWGLALAPGFADPDAASAGTPRYMSPEQARGELPGAASDVFSLGAILFEVVAGRRAFDQAGPEEIRQALIAGRVPPLRAVAPGAPAELAAIVARAMSLEPAERYPDAKALADDLGRYLDGRRVEAFEYSAWALLGRVARAWRAPLIVAGLALIALAGVAIAAFVRIGVERDSAEERLAVSLTVAAESAARVGARAEAEVLAAHALARADLPSARGLLAALAGPRPARERLADVPCRPWDVAGERVLCISAATIGVAERGRVLWQGAGRFDRGAIFIDHGRAVLVTGSTLMLHDAASGVAEALPFGGCGGELQRAADGVRALDVSGKCGAIIGRDGAFHLPAEVCGGVNVGALNAHPDGRHWAVICADGTAVVGGDGDAHRIAVTALSGRLADKGSAVSFVPGSSELLIGTMTGAVIGVDVMRGDVRPVADGSAMVRGVEVDPAGRHALIVRDFGAPVVVELASLQSLGRLPDRRRSAHHIEPDGSIIVAGEHLERWDLSVVRPHRFTLDGGVAVLAVSADGERLAVGHGPRLTVIEPQARRRIGETSWQNGLVKAVSFGLDRRTVSAHGLNEESVRRFATERVLAGAASLPVVALMRRIVTLADGAILGAEYRSGLVLWREHEAPIRVSQTEMRDLVASVDGGRVAALGQDRRVYLGREIHAGGALSPCAETDDGRAIALAPESDAVYVAHRRHIDTVCAETDRGAPYVSEVGDLGAVAVSRTWLVAGTGEGMVILWRRGETRPRALHRAHEGRAAAIVIDPAERWLASGGWDGIVAFMTLPPPANVDPRQVEFAWDMNLPTAFGSSSAPPEWLR